MIYVKGQLKFYDENMNQLHKVKFNYNKEKDLATLIKIIKLKD